MKEYETHHVQLDREMVEFLEAAAREYGLADAGKAIRCLINHAREHAEQRDSIFGEVRCVGC
jgi:hypothetical protein